MVAHLHCEVVRPVTCAARHGSCHVGEALRRRGLARRTVETRAALVRGQLRWKSSQPLTKVTLRASL